MPRLASVVAPSSGSSPSSPKITGAGSRLPLISTRLPARVSYAVHRCDVETVRTSGTNQQAADRHALSHERIEPRQDELERRGPIAERPGGILRTRSRLLDTDGRSRAHQHPVISVAGKAAYDADQCVVRQLAGATLRNYLD